MGVRSFVSDYMNAERERKAARFEQVHGKRWPLQGLEVGPVSIIPARTYIDLLDDLGPRHFNEVYRQQAWVFTAINKIAVMAASLPFKSYGFDAARNRDRLPNEHPLADLISNPFPYGTTMDLVGAICRDVGRYDNALVAKGYEFPGSPPTELWPLDWSKVTIVPGETQPIQGFEYRTTSGKTKLFSRNDVVHFQLRGGVSPLEPLSRTLILEDAAQRQSIAEFRNGMKPSLIGKATQKLTSEQTDALKMALTAHQGPDNAGSVPIIPNVLDLSDFGRGSLKDAEWVAARELTRVEVAAVFGIDPTQIGILDHATFSNVQEAHLAFYMDTLRPWLGMIEDTLRVQLIQLEPAFADTFVEFDMADVLKGNIEQRSEAFQRFLQSGVMTPNELRRLENLPPVNDRGADALYVPLNMQPLDGRIPSPPGSPVGTPALASVEGGDGQLVRALAMKALHDLEQAEERGREHRDLLEALAKRDAPEIHVAPPDVNVNVRPPEKSRRVVFPDGRSAEIELDPTDDSKQLVTFSDGRTAEIKKED